jgi:DNA-binding transcriptional regulator YdaS (Cro superfamily)
VQRARKYEAAVSAGATQTAVAQQFGVTRQQVCQYLAIVRTLPPTVLRRIEEEHDPVRLRQLSYKRLLRIARAPAAVRGALVGELGARLVPDLETGPAH